MNLHKVPWLVLMTSQQKFLGVYSPPTNKNFHLARLPPGLPPSQSYHSFLHKQGWLHHLVDDLLLHFASYISQHISLLLLFLCDLGCSTFMSSMVLDLSFCFCLTSIALRLKDAGAGRTGRLGQVELGGQDKCQRTKLSVQHGLCRLGAEPL